MPPQSDRPTYKAWRLGAAGAFVRGLPYEAARGEVGSVVAFAFLVYGLSSVVASSFPAVPACAQKAQRRGRQASSPQRLSCSLEIPPQRTVELGSIFHGSAPQKVRQLAELVQEAVGGQPLRDFHRGIEAVGVE